MKIFRCPHCQKAVVTSISDKNMQVAISCCHCGFSDYAYIFDLNPKWKSFSKSSEKLSVADVIETLSRQLDNTDLSYINVEEFIYDLHKRCNEFSPIVICKLINTLLERSERPSRNSYNKTLFVKYEPENISLNDIYKKLNEFRDSLLVETLIENPCGESSSFDVQNLKRELELKQHDIDSWIKEYDMLMEKYKQATEENETLKFLLQKKI